MLPEEMDIILTSISHELRMARWEKENLEKTVKKLTAELESIKNQTKQVKPNDVCGF